MPLTRCAWARSELSIPYHDREWGTPHRDDVSLFELIVLEGAQAGLSWETILRKRDRYRAVFDGFDPARVARYNERKVGALLRDPGIVRNAAKIRSAVANARAFLAVAAEHGSFATYLWAFAGGTPIVGAHADSSTIPATTDLSAALSKDLKRRGFGFVGPTIVYAFLQAAGVVNDHVAACFRYDELLAGDETWRPD